MHFDAYIQIPYNKRSAAIFIIYIYWVLIQT